MSWFAAARYLEAEAKRERQRHAALGVTQEQIEAMREALKIFDQFTLRALISDEIAKVLEAEASVFLAKGRHVDTPGPG